MPEAGEAGRERARARDGSGTGAGAGREIGARLLPRKASAAESLRCEKCEAVHLKRGIVAGRANSVGPGRPRSRRGGPSERRNVGPSERRNVGSSERRIRTGRGFGGGFGVGLRGPGVAGSSSRERAGHRLREQRWGALPGVGSGASSGRLAGKAAHQGRGFGVGFAAPPDIGSRGGPGHRRARPHRLWRRLIAAV